MSSEEILTVNKNNFKFKGTWDDHKNRILSKREFDRNNEEDETKVLSNKFSIKKNAQKFTLRTSGLSLICNPNYRQQYIASSKNAGKPSRKENNTENIYLPDIEDKIFQDLENGTASEIEDYYKLLVKQKTLIVRDLTTSISQKLFFFLGLENELTSVKSSLEETRKHVMELVEHVEVFRNYAYKKNLSKKLDDKDTINGNTHALKLKKNDRSSIIALEKIWVDEMNSLFKHVEDASKYFQYIPGRHVLAESGRWYELNVGNWNPTKVAHFFVLNDLLLIATKLNVNDLGSLESKLKSEHCWPLNQVELTQIPLPEFFQNTNDKIYLLNVKSRHHNLIYRTDKYVHLLKILDSFNKGINENLQNQRFASKYNFDHKFIDQMYEEKKLQQLFRNSLVIDQNCENSNFCLDKIKSNPNSVDTSFFFSGSLKNLNLDQNDMIFFKSLESLIENIDLSISRNNHEVTVNLFNEFEAKLLDFEKKSIDIILNNSKSKNLFLIEINKMKLTNRKQKFHSNIVFDLEHGFSFSFYEVCKLLGYLKQISNNENIVQFHLKIVSNHISKLVQKLVLTIEGITVKEIFDHMSSLVIIYVSLIYQTILLHNSELSAVLKVDFFDSPDSVYLVNWCHEEFKTLCSHLMMIFNTYLKSFNKESNEFDNFKLEYKHFFDDFIKVLKKNFDKFKKIGFNFDFIFESIFNF